MMLPLPAVIVADLVSKGWCESCANPWNTAGCYHCTGNFGPYPCQCPCEPKPDEFEMGWREALPTGVFVAAVK